MIVTAFGGTELGLLIAHNVLIIKMDGDMAMLRELEKTENIKDIIAQADKVLLVDFWASWCGPCRMVGPELENLAADLGDKLEIVKANFDDFNEIATAEFKIMGVPTMLICKDGKEQERIVGYRPKKYIKDIVEKYI